MAKRDMGVLVVKEIKNYNDLLMAKNELPVEFAKYIEEQFKAVYEYLNDGEEIREFILPIQNTMIILESKVEFNIITENNIFLEYVEKVNQSGTTFLRLGVYQGDEVQLYYSLFYDY